MGFNFPSNQKFNKYVAVVYYYTLRYLHLRNHVVITKSCELVEIDMTLYNVNIIFVTDQKLNIPVTSNNQRRTYFRIFRRLI